MARAPLARPTDAPPAAHVSVPAEAGTIEIPIAGEPVGTLISGAKGAAGGARS